MGRAVEEGVTVTASVVIPAVDIFNRVAIGEAEHPPPECP